MQKQAQNLYHQKVGNVKPKEYYENNKEKLQEQTRYKHRELSNEEKKKKMQYGRNQYRSMSESSLKLKEYQKIYRNFEKNKAL